MHLISAVYIDFLMKIQYNKNGVKLNASVTLSKE